MQISLQITYEDGTDKTVTAVAADLVAFEMKFDMSVSRLEKEVKLTHLLYIAWAAEKRTKATTDEFEQWVEKVSSVGMQDTKK